MILRRFWAANPVLTLAFLASIGLCLFFTGRTALLTANFYWRAEKPVAGWMTPRYIALAYGVEREALTALLRTTDEDDLAKPLYAIARQNGETIGPVIEAVQGFIDAQDAGK